MVGDPLAGRFTEVNGGGARSHPLAGRIELKLDVWPLAMRFTEDGDIRTSVLVIVWCTHI